MDFIYKTNEIWDNNNYGSINLPQASKYVRKCNFKIIYQEKVSNNYVQYQIPVKYRLNKK